MSEKRILCLEVKNGDCPYLSVVHNSSVAALFGFKPGYYCNRTIDWKPIEKDACQNCKHAKYQGIPREQAIESIGRALCRKGICSRSSDCPKSCDMRKTEVGDWAEAALDALLEVNND